MTLCFEATEPHTCTQLDARALEAWERDGILRITGLIAHAWFDHLRGRLIEVLGAEPEDPLVWPKLQSSLLKMLGRDKRCVALEIDDVKHVVNRLLGAGWEYPQSGGGWFADAPRRLERQHQSGIALIPRGTWHWDGRPDLHAVNGLWLFTPVIEMPPYTAGTWMVAGSARQVTDFYAALSPEKRGQPTKAVRKWFSDAHAWFARLNSGERLNVAPSERDCVRLMNVAGNPGDVVLMRNFTIHSAPEVIAPGARLCQVVVAAHTSDESGGARAF